MSGNPRADGVIAAARNEGKLLAAYAPRISGPFASRF